MHFGYSIYEYGYLYNDHIPNDHHGSHGSADDDDDADHGSDSDSDSESDSDDDVSDAAADDVDALVLLLFALPITLSGPRQFCYIRPKGNFYYFYRFVVGKNSILANFFCCLLLPFFVFNFFWGFKQFPSCRFFRSVSRVKTEHRTCFNRSVARTGAVAGCDGC